MLLVTAMLCCSCLFASCVEIVSCAGSSLKAEVRVGACSSLISRGVDAALRNATCKGTSVVWTLHSVVGAGAKQHKAAVGCNLLCLSSVGQVTTACCEGGQTLRVCMVN